MSARSMVNRCQIDVNEGQAEGDGQKTAVGCGAFRHGGAKDGTKQYGQILEQDRFVRWPSTAAFRQSLRRRLAKIRGDHVDG